MRRHVRMMCAAAGMLAGQLGAQGPVIGEVKQSYTVIKNNLVKMAAIMPEEHYSFKPVPEIRTFGELVAHVADSQTRNCSAVKGAPKQPSAAGKTSKADLVAALNESFAECDAAFESVNEANAGEMAGRRSKLGTLIATASHSNEEYGYMAVYLRLKGIVPPSSQR